MGPNTAMWNWKIMSRAATPRSIHSKMGTMHKVWERRPPAQYWAHYVPSADWLIKYQKSLVIALNDTFIKFIGRNGCICEIYFFNEYCSAKTVYCVFVVNLKFSKIMALNVLSGLVSLYQSHIVWPYFTLCIKRSLNIACINKII